MGSGVFRWRECKCDPGQGDVTVSHERGSRTLAMRMSPDAADRREGVLLFKPEGDWQQDEIRVCSWHPSYRPSHSRGGVCTHRRLHTLTSES